MSVEPDDGMSYVNGYEYEREYEYEEYESEYGYGYESYEDFDE